MPVTLLRKSEEKRAGGKGTDLFVLLHCLLMHHQDEEI